MGDKISQFFLPNQVLENILVMKVAIILVALSLLISSLAILILALSHHRFEKSLIPVKSNSSATLPK